MLGNMIRKPVLSFASRCYEWVVRRWDAAYQNGARAKKIAARVVSVGNITWGGTGKTPLVIHLARQIASRGKRVAVLTRGYGQDETYELKNALAGVPIIVGRDRVRSAEKAVQKYQAEVVILDDGFQHRRLHRDCDIVAVNATNPFGNGFLIPRGILREPVESLRRADVFVLTKVSLGRRNVNLIRQKLREINPRALVLEGDHEPVRLVDAGSNETLELGILQGRSVAVLTGIEDPLSFERLVQRLGAKVAYAARFNDHHRFTAEEMKEVIKSAKDLGLDIILTTSKDSYRLPSALKKSKPGMPRILVMQIEVQIDEEEDLLRRCADL